MKSWSIEDTRELNPPDSPNTVSFLDRLLEFGATSEEILVEIASELEARGGPFVAAFGQLPFDLGLGATKIEAPGDRPGTNVELWVRPVRMTFDNVGRLHTSQANDDLIESHATVTQLIGIIRLNDKRARVHPLYVARLDNIRLLSSQLGSHMVENWMRLPEVTLDAPTRRRRPLTGIDFQRDVAARIRDNLVFATRALLNAYSVAALIDVRDRWFLYGYHAMVAPGRIAGAGSPTPVIKGLIEPTLTPIISPNSLGDIKDTVRSSLRADDPYIRRLQALNTLCLNGEPELALIGACTVLEWFLNQRFPDLAYTTKNGETRSGNIRSFLKSRHAKVLPPNTIMNLRKLVKARNDSTHGTPPSHQTHGQANADSEFAWKALRLTLETYRLVNVSIAEKAV